MRWSCNSGWLDWYDPVEWWPLRKLPPASDLLSDHDILDMINEWLLCSLNSTKRMHSLRSRKECWQINSEFAHWVHNVRCRLIENVTYTLCTLEKRGERSKNRKSRGRETEEGRWLRQLQYRRVSYCTGWIEKITECVNMYTRCVNRVVTVRRSDGRKYF